MSLPAHFAIPGDLTALTGGYGYDREVLARAGQFGIDMSHMALPQSFPAPTQEDLEATMAILQALPRGEPLLVDGLAFGAFPAQLLDLLPAKTIALVHHPLALESGLSAASADALKDSERRALAHVCAVIVTSETTKDLLIADYGVPAGRIAVAMPGTDLAPRSRGGVTDCLQLLAVGSVVPRKGYDILMDALADLASLDWRLTIAGSLTRAVPHVAQVREKIAAGPLADRILFSGEVSQDELERLYAEADVFVMSSLYEGYGMVLGEAMARGLPIVTTTGGAAAQTVPDGAALKVCPGDAPALRNALHDMIVDQELRARMADVSWQAGQALPTWDDTVRIIAETMKRAARGDVS
jgi:glycosyltransferase involved in cell wall biosynthesis